MSKVMKNILILSISCLIGLAGPAKAIDKADVLKRDFNTMISWFEGEFDNMEQVYFDKILNVGDAEEHDRIHSIFKRVPMPLIGETVFYVEQYSDNDPAKIYRQRLYRFSTNDERQAVALNIYSFKNSLAVRGAHNDDSVLSKLGLADLNAMPEGCTVYWQKRANQFVGTMDRGTCQVASKGSGKTLIFEDDLILTEGEIWIQDRAKDTEGNYIFGNKAGVAHKLVKQQIFSCWIFVPATKPAGDTVNGVPGGQFLNNQIISDQGGEIWVPLEGKEGEKVGIKMRNVRWPYGNNRNSLVLYAHNDDSGRAVSYAWTEPDSDRIAVNLRWIQASCTKK